MSRKLTAYTTAETSTTSMMMAVLLSRSSRRSRPPPNPPNIDACKVKRVINPASTPRKPATVITATSRWATWDSSWASTPSSSSGSNRRSSPVVCATTGLLRRLEPEELEGVLAHELSHVAHRDVAVMTVAGFLGVLAGLITRFTLQASMFGGFGGGRDRRDDRDNSTAIIMLVVLVSAVVYAVSFLLIRALSRYRELAAETTAE